MAKFYGAIGYRETYESSPGVYSERIVERQYYGDMYTYSRRLEGGQKVNDDIAVTNTISIVSDPYAMNNFCSIKYAEWMGVKWKVSDVQVAYPRLNLTLGGVYNGSESWTS